jgi:Type II secretion system (T2SS), protein E, N-terminal domain
MPVPSYWDADMTAQFQDLDLQDIQFLIETDDDAAIENDVATIVVSSSIDNQTAFPLINTVLPFEACLYHQILPLYIDGNALYLGMVDLEDRAALDYARQILVFLKYQIITQTISTAAHHQVLSAYLSEQSRRRSPLAIAAPKVPEPVTPEPMTPAELAAANEETAVLDLGLPSTFKLPDQTALTQWPIALHAARCPAARLFQPPPRSSKANYSASKPLPGAALPELLIAPPPVNVSLRSLPAQRLLDALLLRVIQSGVGRLFLVRQNATGRILWTESGVIKATLEDLDLDHLAGTIVALKDLMHCPIEPVIEAPIEVEIERIYQRQRVLLRLRLTPKETGEEATLQILRGAALKFYQQQQIKTLSRDTMSIVAQLRQKMAELQKRTCTAHFFDRQTLDQDKDVMPELDAAIQDIEQQLTQIKQLRATWSH